MDAAQEPTTEQPLQTPIQDVRAQDLNYVPKTVQVLYAPPNITWREKILLPIKEVFITFLPEFIIFSIFIVVMLFAMNYFNFIPLSSNYPKIFGILPHKYDINANKAALDSLKINSDLNSFELEGKLLSFSNNLMQIEYRGKTVELRTANKITCYTNTLKKLSDSQELTETQTVFCSDLLETSNYGRRIKVSFIERENSYVVENVYLEP
jgi:hypothetical protein